MGGFLSKIPVWLVCYVRGSHVYSTVLDRHMLYQFSH